MKYILIIIAFTSINIYAQVRPEDTDGDGFLNITNLEQLRWISKSQPSWKENYELDNDIDASDTKNWNSGEGFEPIGIEYTPFQGIFEGHGHTIYGLYINSKRKENIGLFGLIYSPEGVRNLHLRDIDITGKNTVGGLAGKLLRNVKITNCSATGKVNGVEGVGGLIGGSSGIIKNCYFTGDVSGKNFIGGFMAGSDGLTSNCYFKGTVKGELYVGGFASGAGNSSFCYSEGDVKGEAYVGGFAATNNGDLFYCNSTGAASGIVYVSGFTGINYKEIDYCYTTVDVIGEQLVAGFVSWNSPSTNIKKSFSSGSVEGNITVGGFVALNEGPIKASYSQSTVQGDSLVGGFSALNWNSISNCYSRGQVLGREIVGGFLALNESTASISNNFWDIETSGLEASDGGTGRRSEIMKLMSNYTEVGWDFSNAWRIDENTNEGYPYFPEFISTSVSYDLNNSNLSIYPNPVQSTLYFSLLKNKKIDTVLIHNVSGKLIYSTNDIITVNSVDVAGLIKGQYFISLISDKSIYVQSFIKE
ncbi:MAG: GLUG motif-containing protein [Candidatus Kapaibacterium sp.]